MRERELIVRHEALLRDADMSARSSLTFACIAEERGRESKREDRRGRIGSLYVILKDDNEGFNRGLAITDIARKMENLPRNYGQR